MGLGGTRSPDPSGIGFLSLPYCGSGAVIVMVHPAVHAIQ